MGRFSVRDLVGFVPVDIRSTHPYGFRSGVWARIDGVTWVRDRPCYVVRWDDAVIDTWVINDDSDPYEFRWGQGDNASNDDNEGSHHE